HDQKRHISAAMIAMPVATRSYRQFDAQAKGIPRSLDDFFIWIFVDEKIRNKNRSSRSRLKSQQLAIIGNMEGLFPTLA
ncbi:MAG: hypothetical protein ACREP9_07715, partial [Candidatus Dormibacteraceae bacterium]